MNNIITKDNCAEHFKLDVQIAKNQLGKYEKDSVTYKTLLENLVTMLYDKYETFMDDDIEEMPECDLDIYDALEND